MRNTFHGLQKFASHIPPLAVLLSCLFVTSISFLAIHHFVQKDEDIRFDRSVKSLLEAVEVRLRLYEDILLATRNHFAITPQVSRENFHSFINGFDLANRYPGMQGVGYAIRLKPKDIPKHEHQVRDSGYPDYRVWPEGRRDEYFSIVFLEPFDWRNQRAFGFDMFSESKRRKAMEKARDTGEPVASGKVTLVQETTEDRQSGFLIYVPVYKIGMPTETIAQKRQALIGFIYSPFRSGNLFQNISNDVRMDSARIEFSIYDENSDHDENLLFRSVSGAASAEAEDVANTWGAHERFVQVSMAGHQWTIQIRSTPNFQVRSEKLLPYFILGLGTVISFLVFYVVQFSRQLTQRLLYELKLQENLQEEIIRTQKIAEEANQAKSRFLADMSHEIRTPLGVMIGFTDLALDSHGTKEEIREYLRSIKKNGQQLMELIGDILDLSKIEANKLEVEKLRCSFPQILQDAISSLEFRAKDKGIDLQWDQSQQIPERITTDPTKLRQILINLIGNAIKFTERGFVRITPRVAGDRKNTRDIEVEILIEDTGIGITDEQKAKIFQSFAQADASTTRKYGGTGLGLSISRHLAKALGGSLELVRSQVGQGSVFSLRLHVGPVENYWGPHPAPPMNTEPTHPSF